jgi:hypothetical protein
VLSVPPHLPGPPDASLPAWLRSRTAAIPHTTAELSAPSRAATTARAPIPRVKRYPAMPAHLSAEERIRALVTLPSSSGGTVLGSEHSADRQVDAILALLKARGYRL